MGLKPPTTLPKAGSREFNDILDEMRAITAMEGFDTEFVIDGDEVLLPQTINAETSDTESIFAVLI